MKVIKSIFCALAVMTLFSSAVSAQDLPENRDSSGKFVRGPYITNPFKDNWFVGAGGGVNMFSNKVNNFKAGATPALDVYVGKWFAPAIGVRIGYQGLTGSENSSATAEEYVGKTKERFGFAYLHGDVLFNVSNMIGGFREDRVWSFVPYIHAGYMRVYGLSDEADEGIWPANKSNEQDNEWAAGAGLLNLINVHKRVNLTLDVRESLVSPRFHVKNSGHPVFNLCATLGLQVLLGGTRWERLGDTVDADAMDDLSNALADAQNALAAAKKAAEDALADAEAAKKLADDNAALADSLKAANAKKDDEIERLTAEQLAKRAAEAEYIAYFNIGKYTLTPVELDRLETFISNTLKEDPDHKFYIAGSCDKGTGTEAINVKLCKARANEVRYILRKKFNVKAENIITKPIIISEKHPDDPKLDRCCLLEKE